MVRLTGDKKVANFKLHLLNREGIIQKKLNIRTTSFGQTNRGAWHTKVAMVGAAF